MTTRELLVEARALVARGWTQNVYSRDAEGKAIPFGSQRCCSFCLSGAVQHAGVMGGAREHTRYEVLDLLRAAIGVDSAVVPWNDAKERTQQEVLDLIDATIKTLDERGETV